MAEQLLHRADVVTVFEQMCCKRMPQRVATHVLNDTSRARGFLYVANQLILIHVVTPDHAGARIG